MSDLYERIYAIVKQIPYGKVCSYGIIAQAIGSGKSARVVGYAMNHSHSLPEAIPAHRVVNRNGLLTGRHHFAHPNLMQELLESEGLVIMNHQIQNFESHLWIPIR